MLCSELYAQVEETYRILREKLEGRMAKFTWQVIPNTDRKRIKLLLKSPRSYGHYVGSVSVQLSMSVQLYALGGPTPREGDYTLRRDQTPTYEVDVGADYFSNRYRLNKVSEEDLFEAVLNGMRALEDHLPKLSPEPIRERLQKKAAEFTAKYLGLEWGGEEAYHLCLNEIERLVNGAADFGGLKCYHVYEGDTWHWHHFPIQKFRDILGIDIQYKCEGDLHTFVMEWS